MDRLRLTNYSIDNNRIQDFKDVLAAPEDANHFWFAIGSAQWDCGNLADETLEKKYWLSLAFQYAI